MALTAEQLVSPEWRASMLARMSDIGMSMAGLARAAGSSLAAVSYVLSKANASRLVPVIEQAVTRAEHLQSLPHPILAEVAELRQSKDEIDADIIRLETVRATVEERIAEAYEHRAKIEIKIRTLRGLP